MAKSKARFLSELLGSTGLVKKSKSALAGADEVLDLDTLPTIPNSKLQNSSISIAGHSTALGDSVTLNTGNIGEHTNYKYFTDARARAAVSVSGDLAYNSSTGVFSFTERTDAEVRGLISATGSLSYNSTTGVMSFTMPAQNTSNVTEGSNLYFTNARADARIAAASTSDLSEGTNLYYTDARADARVALIVDSAPGTLNTLNELAAALGDDANFSTTITNSIAAKLPLAGGALTGAVTTNSTFDGRNVSVDGAKLDGIETGATADQTAAEILTAVKTVDGSGSGLDADLLDGYQKADINPAHSHYRWTGIAASGTQARRFVIMRLYGCPAHWDSNWQDIHLKVWSETYEATNLKYEICGDYAGAGTQANMFQLRLKDAGGSSEHGRFRLVLGTPVDAGWDYSGADTYYVDVYAEASHYMNFTVAADFYSAGFNVNTLPTSGGATSVVYSSPTVSNITTFNEAKEHSYFANHKIWNDGNHGSASGLDADLLDGIHASSFVRSDANDTKSGNLVLQTSGAATDTTTGLHFEVGGSYNDGRYRTRFRKQDVGGGIPLYIDQSGSTANSYTAQARFGTYSGNNYEFEVYGDINATGSIYDGGNAVWHTGNDGSGSGLDADLLDGMNATDSRAGNTIVKRQANGYMQAVYVNTTDDASSVNLGWLYGQRSNSDGYHRRFTAASIRDWGGFFTTANDGSGSGLDADLLDGQHASAFALLGGTNHARSIPNRWFATADNDNNIDYYQHAYAKAHLGNTYKYTTSRPVITADSNYWVGSMGWSNVDLNTVMSYGSGFWDSWSTPANRPSASGGTHWNGFNAMHYSNGTSYMHGMQMAMGAGNPAHTYLRGWWANGGSGYGWQKIWTDGNDGSGSGLDADLLDGVDSLSFVRSDANDTLSGQYTFTKVNDHAIKVGTIRGTAVGSQGGEFIQLYERVNIGGPSGWGASDTSTQSRGLSVMGGADLAKTSGSVTISGSTAWHAGNDGSGSGLDADLLDGKSHENFGATLATYSTTSGTGGRIRCTAPFNTNSGKMFQVTVSLYTSYQIRNYVVAGYMYSTSNQWYSATAIYSGVGTPDIKVGRDSNGKAYISIARGSYTGVRVHNMTRGYYTSVADTYDPWTITENDATENSLTPTTSTTWHSGNDGAGSGLDADLLDGQQGSYYYSPANPSPDTNTTYNFGGSTFTSRNSGNPTAIDGVTTNMVGYVNGSTAAGFGDGAGFSAAYSSSWIGQLFVDFRTGKLSTRGKNSGTWQAHRFMWDNLNDGSGSGLDADLLDGQQGSYYLPVSSTINGYARAQGRVVTNVNDAAYRIPGMYGFNNVPSNGPGTNYSAMIVAANSDVGLQIVGGYTNNQLYFRGWHTSGSTYLAWNKVWHSTNDGSGSGLDADLLDGQQGSYYASVTHANTQAATRTRTASSYTGNHNFSAGALQFQTSNSGQSAHSYAIFQEAGAWAHPYPDLRIAYHTGIKLGAHTSYGGTRFYSNSDMITLLFSVGNGDSNVRVTNNIYATQFLYNSDRAYKENIYPLENSLQKVLKLEGVNYTLKSNGTELIGFIAQDVEKIEPKVVDGKEGEKAVNYGQMVALLTEAMKEQQNMIVALQEEVKELKNATK